MFQDKNFTKFEHNYCMKPYSNLPQKGRFSVRMMLFYFLLSHSWLTILRHSLVNLHIWSKSEKILKIKKVSFETTLPSVFTRLIAYNCSFLKTKSVLLSESFNGNFKRKIFFTKYNTRYLNELREKARKVGVEIFAISCLIG